MAQTEEFMSFVEEGVGNGRITFLYGRQRVGSDSRERMRVECAL